MGNHLRIDKREFDQYTTMLGVSIFAIMIVNAITMKFAKFSPVPVNASLFAVLIGIAEESFFRGFLQTLFISLAGDWLGIIITSLIWMTFHGAVYGLNQPALFVVFGAGIILGWVVYITRRLSITMTAHGLINFLAIALGGG